MRRDAGPGRAGPGGRQGGRGGRLGVDQEPDQAAEPAAGRLWGWTSTTCRRTCTRRGGRCTGRKTPRTRRLRATSGSAEVLHTAKHEGYEKLREQLQEWKARLRGTSAAAGGGAGAELRDGSAGDDPVPEVPGTGPADRQRADGVDVQGDHATDQGSGDALGRGQRRGIMALEALEQSGAWQDYWQICLIQAG